MPAFRETQHAVQLVGPDQLKLNPEKPVPTPGDHEMLLKTEAVGLCFSDLKLLKQFDQHARKSEIVTGLEASELAGIQSYVPGEKPTVPGHEVVAQIVAVGSKVTQHAVGERVLVQTDYRGLKTAGSNAAFGYNFEGALQEFVIVDERVAIDTDGQRFLIPVGSERSAAAVALVEPWACVEDSYVTVERQTIKADGKLLIVADEGADTQSVEAAYAPEGAPAEVVRITPDQAAGQPDEGFDDVVYFGSDKATIEALNDKLGTCGIMNVVLSGKTIGSDCEIGVGRIHYGMTRWIGTPGSNAADSYRMIPETGEIRANDNVLVVGAGGPMGQMHIIRNVCTGLPGVSVVGTDFDDPRLESLNEKAGPIAQANGVSLKLVNPKTNPLDQKFSYTALMAPVPVLVAQSIVDSTDDAIINIFAGIPAPVKHPIDLDMVIAKRAFMFGTSGSTINDMKIVLAKVESGQLDTSLSVDAISGMAGAEAGIRAVENRTLAGKIIVYPQLRPDIGLIPLTELDQHFPTVAAKLDDGKWTGEAERELLTVGAPEPE